MKKTKLISQPTHNIIISNFYSIYILLSVLEKKLHQYYLTGHVQLSSLLSTMAMGLIICFLKLSLQIYNQHYWVYFSQKVSLYSISILWALKKNQQWQHQLQQKKCTFHPHEKKIFGISSSQHSSASSLSSPDVLLFF